MENLELIIELAARLKRAEQGGRHAMDSNAEYIQRNIALEEELEQERTRVRNINEALKNCSKIKNEFETDLEESREAVEELQAKVNVLQKENERLKIEDNELRYKLQCQTERANEFEGQLVQEKKRVFVLERENEQLKDDSNINTILRVERDKAREDYNNLQREHEMLKVEKVKYEQTSERYEQNLRVEIKELQKEINELKERNKTLSATNERLLVSQRIENDEL